MSYQNPEAYLDHLTPTELDDIECIDTELRHLARRDHQLHMRLRDVIRDLLDAKRMKEDEHYFFCRPDQDGRIEIQACAASSDSWRPVVIKVNTGSPRDYLNSTLMRIKLATQEISTNSSDENLVKMRIGTILTSQLLDPTSSLHRAAEAFRTDSAKLYIEQKAAWDARRLVESYGRERLKAKQQADQAAFLESLGDYLAPGTEFIMSQGHRYEKRCVIQKVTPKRVYYYAYSMFLNVDQYVGKPIILDREEFVRGIERQRVNLASHLLAKPRKLRDLYAA